MLTFTLLSDQFGQFSELCNFQTLVSCLPEPVHDKIYNKTCQPSKDSNKPVHSPNMAGVLDYLSLDSLEAVEGTRGQRKL